MASLIEIRDLLALHGRMEAQQVSQILNTPQPLVDAMLQRLEAMGRVIKREEDAQSCLTGSCKNCPEGKACLTEWWSIA